MGRLTVRPGLRYDRMVGNSQDIPQYDLEFNEVGTLQGRGHLITWNQVSPRVGANFRLTQDGKTILRGVAGRYYLPLFLGEFEGLHPGRATSTTRAFDSSVCPGATIQTVTPSCYTTVLNVVNPIANIRFDGDTNAPYTDQYAIGMDRELVANMAVGVNVVYKRSEDMLGWTDIGGQYGTRDVTVTGTTNQGDVVNQVLTVFPRLTPAAQSVFLRTNGAGFYNRYKAMLLTLTKRMSNRWQATLGYTLQRAEGLDPGGTAGRDPTDLVNQEGGLGARDRPHMLSLMGSYELPKIAVQVSGNLTAVSGIAIASTANVTGLPQGNKAVNLQAPGTQYRTPVEKFMHMRVTKIMFRQGPRRLEITGEIKNTLNQQAVNSIQSTVFNNANFMLPNVLAEPRQLRLFFHWFF
jgi:hypothetical protein